MHISKAEIKLLRSLTRHKEREELKMFFVEGWRSLKDALHSGFQIEFVAITTSYLKDPDDKSIVGEIEQRKIAIKELTEAELRQVSDTIHAQGAIALVRQKSGKIEDLAKREQAIFVVADRMADPGNLGSLVRTCDWFGVDALILTEGSVDLYNEKVVRSTAGSIFHIPVVAHARAEEMLTLLRDRGFRIVGTAGEAKTAYSAATFGHKTALIVGSEANGLSAPVRKLCDEIVRIERHGKAESLNVVVACGIVLSHIRKVR